MLTCDNDSQWNVSSWPLNPFRPPQLCVVFRFSSQRQDRISGHPRRQTEKGQHVRAKAEQEIPVSHTLAGQRWEWATLWATVIDYILDWSAFLIASQHLWFCSVSKGQKYCNSISDFEDPSFLQVWQVAWKSFTGNWWPPGSSLSMPVLRGLHIKTQRCEMVMVVYVFPITNRCLAHFHRFTSWLYDPVDSPGSLFLLATPPFSPWLADWHHIMMKSAFI